jgi:hypothetical protein
MIRFQIVETTGANLYKRLVGAMRDGDLRTFGVAKRGHKVQHTNASYPAWMNWSEADGIINCKVISPKKPGREWQLFSAFLGRLADRYAEQIVSINVQFPSATYGKERRGLSDKTIQKVRALHTDQELTFREIGERLGIRPRQAKHANYLARGGKAGLARRMKARAAKGKTGNPWRAEM